MGRLRRCQMADVEASTFVRRGWALFWLITVAVTLSDQVWSRVTASPICREFVLRYGVAAAVAVAMAVSAFLMLAFLRLRLVSRFVRVWNASS